MPKYLMLIVESEAAYEDASEADFNDVMEAHTAFTKELEELGGKSLGGEALQPTWRRRRSCAAPASDGHRRRQPGARPQGGARRLLPRRGRRRRPRPPDRRALPGAVRLHRGAPDLGDPRRRDATSRPRRRAAAGRPPAVLGSRARAPRCGWPATSTSPRRRRRTRSLLALQTWPERGVPDSVEAWLLTAARRRAIDRIRRLGPAPRAAGDDRRHGRRSTAGRRRRRRRARPCSTTSCASSCCAATRRSTSRPRSR